MSNDDYSDFKNRDFIYTIPEQVLFDEELSITDLRIYAAMRSCKETMKEFGIPTNRFCEYFKFDSEETTESFNKLLARHHIDMNFKITKENK